MNVRSWRVSLSALLGLIAVIVTASGQKAVADYVTQTYDLTVTNTTLASGTTYGTVLVEAYNGTGTAPPTGNDLGSGDVRLTFHVDSSQFPSPNSGFGMDKIAWDATTSAGTISAANGFSAASGGTQMDGFGSFTYRYDLSPGTVTTEVVTISGLDANAGLGYIGSHNSSNISPVSFSVHVRDFGSPTSTYLGDNGPESGPPPGSAVPEPSTIALALSGLAGFGLVGLMRFRRRSVVA